MALSVNIDLIRDWCRVEEVLGKKRIFPKLNIALLMAQCWDHFLKKNIRNKKWRKKRYPTPHTLSYSCLCLVRVVELSLFSCANLGSIVLLWIVFLLLQIFSLCLLNSSSWISVFTSVPFFHKVGEEPINRINWPPMLPGLPNQLINSISPGCRSNIWAASHCWSNIKCETYTRIVRN